ncbi:hypothetical protein AVEN_112866-1 [Araneus ventricosus]|uniref:Uncharacterized protein n=1 Tax=Araneus ventricosus TaxID=182803 RepID=A0A4Y2HTS2_ARAVE|nr:hypothetical protein AVEN_112866-1 [Araneus ventricosus]
MFTTTQQRGMGKEQTHLEPLIIACQAPIKGELESFGIRLVCRLVRSRFAGSDELHSKTSQSELRIPLRSPKNQQDLAGTEPKTPSTPESQQVTSGSRSVWRVL